jgi:hypothetical protein
VLANTGRATTTIMIATTAHLISSQSARERTTDPPAVPRDYAIKFHLASRGSTRREFLQMRYPLPLPTAASPYDAGVKSARSSNTR